MSVESLDPFDKNLILIGRPVGKEKQGLAEGNFFEVIGKRALPTTEEKRTEFLNRDLKEIAREINRLVNEASLLRRQGVASEAEKIETQIAEIAATGIIPAEN